MTALPRPINRLGPVKARWVKWQAMNRLAVFRRSRGKCELCGVPASEAHHTHGRRAQVAEPLASHHTMVAALCNPCHALVTREPASEEASRLRIAALQRAREHFGLDESVVSAWLVEDSLKASGAWADLLQEAGR